MSKKRRQRVPQAGAAGPGEGLAAPLAGSGAVQGEEAGGKAAGAGFFWFSALFLILIGYLSLVKADAGGKNAWAILSPACLLTGYLLLIPAISRSFRK